MVLIWLKGQRSASQGLVTAFGNSITANVNNYCISACRESSGELIFIKNAGIGGNTTAQMIARMATDIPAESSIVMIMEATNDAGSGATFQATPLEHAQNMLTIANYVLSQGMKPIFILAPPKDDTEAAQRIEEMNFYNWCTARALGIPCYDPWRTFSDTNGQWIPGASDDGTHPVDQTNFDAGQILNAQIKANEYALPITRNNNHGILSNSLLQNVSGSYPTGFIVYGGGSSGSYEPSVSGLGNQITASVNNGTAILDRTYTALTVGDKHIFTCLFSASSMVGVNYALYLDEQGGSRHYLIQNGKVNISERYLTIEFTPSVADVRLIASVAGTGSGSVTLAQTQIFNISANTIV